jgi:hypothetical protein
VGYNPFRERVKHQGDVLIVATAILVIALLLVWGFFG